MLSSKFTPPLPLIGLFNVQLFLVYFNNFAVPDGTLKPLLAAMETFALPVASVAPFLIMTLSASALPGTAPKFLSLVIKIPPAVISVPPV